MNKAKIINITKYILLLPLILVAIIIFSGCGTTPFRDNPNADDVVYGNGSLAVTKGDYLYFVNGYIASDEVGDTNHEGSVTYGALYRIKLDDNGNPVEVEPEYDEDGNEIFDGSNALQNVDVLASKVAGFEDMGLYIFGDYIYYASPYNGMDSNREVLSDQVDIFRIKLDRSGSSEWLYTTDSANTEVQYSMFEINGEVCLAILDGTKLVAIKFDQNGNKQQTTVSENATSVAFFKYTTSNQTVSEFNHDLYYTRDITEEDDVSYSSGNVVCKFNFATFTNTDKIFMDGTSTITFEIASTDRLFYEKQLSTSQNDTVTLYSVRDVANIGGANETRISNSYSTYNFTPSGNSTVVAYDSDNTKIILVNYPNLNSNVELYSGSATVIDVIGSYVYFTDNTNNTICRINYVEMARFVKGETSTPPEVETLSVSGETVFTGQANYVAIYGDKIYYLNTYDSGNYYLHQIDLSQYDSETSSYYDHFIGVLLEEDYETESSE